MENKILNIISKTGWMLPIAVILMVGSCKKNDYLGYKPGTGKPTISSVHTLSKTDSSIVYDTIVTYNSAGVPSTQLDQKPFLPRPFDSAVVDGNLGNYYVIEGTNLGTATSV